VGRVIRAILSGRPMPMLPFGQPIEEILPVRV
jgi:hypothetical protein